MTFRPLPENLALLELNSILILTQVHKQICHLWTPGSTHHHLFLFSCSSHLQTSPDSKTLAGVPSLLCQRLPWGHCVPRSLGLIFLQSSGTSEHQGGVELQRTMGEPSSPDSVTATGPGPALNRPDIPQSFMRTYLPAFALHPSSCNVSDSVPGTLGLLFWNGAFWCFVWATVHTHNVLALPVFSVPYNENMLPASSFFYIFCLCLSFPSFP